MYSIAEKFSIAIQCVIWKGAPNDTKRKNVAEAVGISPQSFGDYVLGRKKTGDEEVRRKICDYFGVNYEKLLEFGNDLLFYLEPDNEDGVGYVQNLELEIKEGRWDKELLWIQDNPSNIPQELSEFTLIPKYRARLSGGHGSYQDSDRIEASYSFRTEFLQKKGNPSNMALFEVDGESMEPFMYHGDVVLVDMSLNDIHNIGQGKAYAFREDSRVVVKRLLWQGKKLIAKSENQAYGEYEIDTQDDFSLIGKIIWVGHEVK